MAPPPPPPVIAPDFDSPEYDAAQQRTAHGSPEQQMEQAVQGALEEIMLLASLSIHEHRANQRLVLDAVDSCLTTCLDVVEMQYPAREDNPVSTISLEQSSWEQESPPLPCALDSWLRSALPEANPASTSGSGMGATNGGSGAGRESWAMQQFLSKQPSMHRGIQRSSSGLTDSDPAPQHGRSRASMVGGASMRSMRGASRRNVTKLDTRKQLTPEQELTEEQLRQELQQRKTQEEMSRRLEQKDSEERAKLASLRKELKGKDYTYDHKGEVVILNEFDPDRTPLEALSGPGYKVAVPEDPSRTLSPKRRNTFRSMTSSRGLAAAEAAAAAAARGSSQLSPTEMRKERERRLAADFKKTQPKTQPSALETMSPVGGVTLRGAGGATKTGPLRPLPAGITRDAYTKQVAKKALQAQESGGNIGHGGPGTPGTGRMASNMFRDGPPTGGMSGMRAKSMAQPPWAAGAAGAGGGGSPGVPSARGAGVLDPLSGYHAGSDPLAGAKLRPRNLASAGSQRSDVNLSLVEAADWGTTALGRGYEPPSSLPRAKPTEKQLIETVGRYERLPRERAPQPTIGPPLSPSKAGAQKETGRLQFTSVLAE